MKIYFSQRKYFLVADFSFPMQSVYINIGTFVSCGHVVHDITSTASWKMSTMLRMQDIRLKGDIEIIITRTQQLNDKSVCTLYSNIFSCFTMVNTLFLLFSFITEDSVFKMASIQVLLQSAYLSLC